MNAELGEVGEEAGDGEGGRARQEEGCAVVQEFGGKTGFESRGISVQRSQAVERSQSLHSSRAPIRRSRAQGRYIREFLILVEKILARSGDANDAC